MPLVASIARVMELVKIPKELILVDPKQWLGARDLDMEAKDELHSDSA